MSHMLDLAYYFLVLELDSGSVEIKVQQWALLWGGAVYIFLNHNITVMTACSTFMRSTWTEGSHLPDPYFIGFLQPCWWFEHTLMITNKGPSSQGYGFSSGHVWISELDYKESLVLKNLCFWTVVLEKTLESPLDCKESQPVHPKGDQSWVFIGRTDAEAETPTLWPPVAKSWFTGKEPDSGKDRRQEEKGTTEDEMAGCHHRLSGDEFE